MRRLAPILAAALVFTAGVVYAGGQITTPGSGVWTDQGGHNLRIVSANLRNYVVGGWTATSPTSHAALGIDGVVCDATGALIVHLTPNFQGGLTVWATPDERYIRKGMLIGLWLNPDSIGLRLKQVTANGIGTLNCYESILIDDNANIWIGGLGIMP